MGGGLSVGPSAGKRKIGDEFPQLLQLFKHTFGGSTGGTLGQFTGGQPLLGMASNQAQGYGGGISDLLAPLMSNFKSLTSGALGKEFQGFDKSLAGMDTQLARPIAGLSAAYDKNIAPIIASGGALTGEQERDVTQKTDASFAARGNVSGNQAFTSEFLNRQSAKDARFNTALSQGQAVQGEIGGIEGERAGLIGQREGLIGQRQQLEQGAASGIQGLQSGGLNQLTGVESAITGNYAQLTDPLLSYAGNLFGENLQAQQQTQQANQNKGGAIPGEAGSVLGNIIGGIAKSDKRLKHKIKNIGEKTPEGIPIKTFQYRDDPRGRRYIGVIAQDVEKHAPHAVHHDRHGFKHVNFSAIHAPFHQLGGGKGRKGKGRKDDPSKDSPWMKVRSMSYGPIVGEHHRAANFGPKGNKLGPHDVAVTPDLEKKFPLGSIIEDPKGVRLRVADRSRGGPKGQSIIERRDIGDIGHMAYRLISAPGRFAGRTARTIGHAVRGFPSGSSGYPRAIAVGGRRGGGRHHRGMFGGDGGPGGGGGIAPGSMGFGGPGSGPGGGFPSSVAGSPFTGSSPFGGSPNVAGGSPASPDISGSIPWNMPDTPIDPWTFQDFSGFTGSAAGDYGSTGGIQ